MTTTPTAVPAGYALVRTPITDEMHAAAAKVLVRAHGLDGTPQRMLDAMIAAAPPAPAAAEQAEPVVGFRLLPSRLTNEMRAAMADAAREYMARTGGNSPDAMYDAAVAAAPPAPARQEPLADLPPNEKLLALADRIDHEKLWSRAGLERPDWTQEQHDRCDAGVHLRRYAALLGQDWWRIYPPRGSNSFCSETLDGAVRLARKHERMFPAAPITAAPAEGGAA